MFNSFKIGSRLGAAFAFILLLLGTVGGFGLYQAGRINAGAHELATSWLPSVKVLGEIRSALNEERRAVLRHLLEITPEGKARQEAARGKAVERMGPLLERYSTVVTSPEEAKLFDAIKARYKAQKEQNDKVIALSKEGEVRFLQARQLAVGESAEAFRGLMDVVTEDIELNNRGADKEAEKAQDTYASARTISVAIIVAAAIAGCLLAWSITRSIVRPIRIAVDVAESVAAGDLTSKFEAQGQDETAQLLGALLRMNDNLARIVGQVRASSDSIATGSTQIATGNTDLSQRTEEQASNLQQTAASMEQISSTVKASAETAGQANQLAASASASAVKGGEMVGDVVNTMQDIAASSRKIVDIIGVIDGIAFQTNILALNAAVEAARAGEQGRGFAVVASEVRSLASRSAEAAKEIKSLIGTSVEKVEAGTRQVNQAGSSMGEIVTQVQRVSLLIKELSNASAEQAQGVGQIGDAVTQLDQVTQQNAALVEESAAAAESLKHQAASLAEVVSVFKVGAGQAVSAVS